MMKAVPMVIFVSKNSAQNLAEHLVQVVQCVQTHIIATLTIKFVKKSARRMETVFEDGNVMGVNA